jgi:DNA-binding response OmpR family regulator
MRFVVNSASGNTTPVLFTALWDDRITGFIGADDYLTKPFSFREYARIRALLRVIQMRPDVLRLPIW